MILALIVSLTWGYYFARSYWSAALGGLLLGRRAISVKLKIRGVLEFLPAPRKRLGLTTTGGGAISGADSGSRRPADHTTGGAISGADSGSRRPADRTSDGAISGVSNRLFRREREPGCRPGSWLTPVRRRLTPVCKHRTLQTAPRRILRIFSWGILLSTHRKHTPFQRSWLLTL